MTMKSYGFMRVGAAVPAIRIADVASNIDSIINLCEKAYAESTSLLVFPELCVTGYTCADLFLQSKLTQEAVNGLEKLREASVQWKEMAVVVGLPVAYNDSLYNCAAVLSNGCVRGIVPKSYLPNYSEFYEKRWFASATTLKPGVTLTINGCEIPFGRDLLFEIAGVKCGIEICEDMWTPLPPSTFAALAGAKVIINLSASNELAAKHDYLVSLLKSRSAALQTAYIYSSAGTGESTTDVVYSGNAIIAENGTILRHSDRFSASELLEICDVDIEALTHDRMTHVTFTDNASDIYHPEYKIIPTGVAEHDFSTKELKRTVIADPFVPEDPEMRRIRCREIINIQTEGLMQRLRATGMKSVTVGISGGLDSTLAILVASTAFARLGLPMSNIIGITMPGFGTTGRTYENAKALVQLLGATLLEISISDAVKGHFNDIGHDINVHDLTYENSQARERTQILMDVSGKYGGMVLGTGDLSELALGWCTYNGDHISMYGINASIPKTLVRHLVSYFAETTDNVRLHDVLEDIIATPVSPELIPADANGEIAQKTENLVGPYALHDFFIYNTLRYGFSPSKVYMLACNAFEETYPTDVIKKWLKEFYRRFFTQQFKRSCMPDGPKVGSICLSPRGDWRMPSDATSAMWLKECDNLPD